MTETWLCPAPDWCWQFDPEKQLLILQNSQQESFVTAFKNKHLALNQPLQEPFTVEQTEVFHRYAEALHARVTVATQTRAIQTVLSHICIHAVAAAFYHKAVANKSYWFIKQAGQTGEGNGVLLSPLVSLQTQLSESRHGGLCESDAMNHSTLNHLALDHLTPDHLTFNRDALNADTEDNSSTGCGLVLSVDGQFATILLLSAQLMVTEEKVLPRYTVLKTHLNTLREADASELASAFKNVSCIDHDYQ